MIIKELIKANICFAVIQYNSTLKLNKWVEFKEWEIIALQEDKNKLFALCKDGEHGMFDEKQGGYEKTSDQRNPQGIISRNMSFDEITEFKKLMHFFNIHNHKTDGRMYELKKDPLKEKYQQINKF
jgi:hypothetical protein